MAKKAKSKKELSRCPICDRAIPDDKYRYITLDLEQERKKRTRELRSRDTEIKHLREHVASLLKQVERLRPEPTGKNGYIASYHETIDEGPQPLAQKVIRKPISPGTRMIIYARDEHACVYCGATSEDEPLNIDHVIPITRGGSNEMDNLVTACQSCNFLKRDKLLEEWDRDARMEGFESLPDYLQQKMRKREQKHARLAKKAKNTQEARHEAIDE